MTLRKSPVRVLTRSMAAVAAVGALLTTACAGETQTTDEWKSPTYQAGPVKKVIVFGATQNAGSRRSLEDGLVSALQSHGVSATPSYTMYPGAIPAQDQVRGAITQAGFDGMLISKLQGVHERQTVVPGYTAGVWDGYYGPDWGSTWYPAGYVETDQLVNFDTTLWDPRTGKMIWSDDTQTTNPSSGSNFVTSLTHNVIPAMAKAGLIGK